MGPWSRRWRAGTGCDRSSCHLASLGADRAAGAAGARLAKDFEALVESATSWLMLASVKLLSRRLARISPAGWAWGSRSAARSSRHTADSWGPRRTSRAAPCSDSCCRRGEDASARGRRARRRHGRAATRRRQTSRKYSESIPKYNSPEASGKPIYRWYVQRPHGQWCSSASLAGLAEQGTWFAEEDRDRGGGRRGVGA